MSYEKLKGLQELQDLGLLVPPYHVINHDEFHDDPEKIWKDLVGSVGIPDKPGTSLGVTIRITVPDDLLRRATHGGLHHQKKKIIINTIASKFEKYGPYSKIIIQHTIDALSSGAIIIESNRSVLECIPGDAPDLLEGRTTNQEIWQKNHRWEIIRAYRNNGIEKQILSQSLIRNFDRLIRPLAANKYLEWSLSRNGKFYFYEYMDLQIGKLTFIRSGYSG